MGPPTPVKVPRTGLFLGLFVMITIEPRVAQKTICKELQVASTMTIFLWCYKSYFFFKFKLQLLFLLGLLGEWPRHGHQGTRMYLASKLSVTIYFLKKQLLHYVLLHYSLFQRCRLLFLSVITCLKEILNITLVSKQFGQNWLVKSIFYSPNCLLVCIYC